MINVPKNLGWYEILKDIIIPLLGVLSTIVIGTVIAVLLKRKEEKAKIKSLLIDNYMLFLNQKVKFFAHELDTFTHQIFKDIYINYGDYFELHANSHISKEKIAKRRDQLKGKLSLTNQDEINWSPFTYKFCFLLGTKVYSKEAQKLENDTIKNYFQDDARNKLKEDLKNAVIKNVEIKKKINSSNSSDIDDGIDNIEHLIAVAYNEIQFKIFTPYDNKIADLIDAY